MRLCAQHHVFQGGEGIDQHEVLVHHANAQGDGVIGVANVDGLAEDLNLAGVGPVEAIKHRHQCALAGTVFSNDAMDRPRRHLQGDIHIGLNRSKPLVDALHPHRWSGTVHQYLQALSAM